MIRKLPICDPGDESKDKVIVWVDSDVGRDPDTRKSMTGYLMCVNEALFPWDRLDKVALPYLCYFLRSSRSEGSVHAPHTSTCASRASSSPTRSSTPLVSFQKWDFDKILTRNKQKLHIDRCMRLVTFTHSLELLVKHRPVEDSMCYHSIPHIYCLAVTCALCIYPYLINAGICTCDNFVFPWML